MRLNKEILRLAIPSIVSNITVPLLGLCDTTISGHLGSARYLAAIAVGTMAWNAIFWCLGFLRMGTTGLTAQAFGRGDMYATRRLFSRSLSAALLIGVLIILFQTPLSRLTLGIMGAESAVNESALSYFRIIVWGAPAILGTMVVSGWFLGMQSSVQPMVIAIVTNLVNILASLISVFVLRIGFQGIAIGTMIASWVGMLLALLLVMKFNGGKLPLIPLGALLRDKGWGLLFNVNIFIFLRSFCIMGVTMGVTSVGARLGTDVLAANAVMMQFFVFYSHFMDGFAFSGEALTGKAVGKGDGSLLRSVVRHLMGWCAAMTLLFLLLYSVSYRQIAGFITDEVSALRLIEEYHIWLILLPLSGVAFLYDGIYIGLTATSRMLASALIGLISFFTIIWLTPLSPENTLWLAFLSYLLLRGIVLAVLYRNESRRALRVVNVTNEC